MDLDGFIGCHIGIDLQGINSYLASQALKYFLVLNFRQLRKMTDTLKKQARFAGTTFVVPKRIYHNCSSLLFKQALYELGGVKELEVGHTLA